MKRTRVLIGFLSVLALLAIFFSGRSSPPSEPQPSLVPTPLASPSIAGQIIFPAGGETLTAGQTYTLKWTDNGEPNPTQIFLLDTATATQGASAAVSDKMFNVTNSGSYQYTIPKNIRPGTYAIEVGLLTSRDFRIVPATASARPPAGGQTRSASASPTP